MDIFYICDCNPFLDLDFLLTILFFMVPKAFRITFLTGSFGWTIFVAAEISLKTFIYK